MAQQSKIMGFVGMSRTVNNEADILLEQLFEKVLHSIDMFSGLSYEAYRSIELLLDAAEQKEKNPYSYFWSWLREHGLRKMKVIAGKELGVMDELLDLLEYRLFVLGQDVDSQNLHNIIESIADCIDAVFRFLDQEHLQYSWESPVSSSYRRNWFINTSLDGSSGGLF